MILLHSSIRMARLKPERAFAPGLLRHRMAVLGASSGRETNTASRDRSTIDGRRSARSSPI